MHTKDAASQTSPVCARGQIVPQDVERHSAKSTGATTLRELHLTPVGVPHLPLVVSVLNFEDSYVLRNHTANRSEMRKFAFVLLVQGSDN